MQSDNQNIQLTVFYGKFISRKQAVIPSQGGIRDLRLNLEREYHRPEYLQSSHIISSGYGAFEVTDENMPIGDLVPRVDFLTAIVPLYYDTASLNTFVQPQALDFRELVHYDYGLALALLRGQLGSELEAREQKVVELFSSLQQDFKDELARVNGALEEERLRRLADKESLPVDELIKEALTKYDSDLSRKLREQEEKADKVLHEELAKANLRYAELEKTVMKLDEQLGKERMEREADSSALASAILDNNTTKLYEIRLRHLLNDTQRRFADIAGIAGLTRLKNNPSLEWRRALDKCGEDTETRKTAARKMLSSAPEKLSALIQSDEAMELLCEQSSSIRLAGDEAAHPNIFSSMELQALRAALGKLGLSESRQRGMDIIIDFHGL